MTGMTRTTFPALDIHTARDIADEMGFTGTIFDDVRLANTYTLAHDPEKLFRGYLADYLAERNADAMMLSRTGLGFTDY